MLIGGASGGAGGGGGAPTLFAETSALDRCTVDSAFQRLFQEVGRQKKEDEKKEERARSAGRGLPDRTQLVEEASVFSSCC